MKKYLFVALAILLLASPAMAQRKVKEPKNKLGVAQYRHTGAIYELQSVSTGAITTGTGVMVGPAFFYERVFKSRFSAGLKYSTGLDRSLSLSLDGSAISVVETTTLTSFDFKAYFKDHSAPGFKPYLGVGWGTLASTSAVTTTAAGSSSSSEGSTTATVPITSLNFGFDYVMEFGAVRFDLGNATGSRRDLTSHSAYKANYTMDGSSVAIGVYSFF